MPKRPRRESEPSAPPQMADPQQALAGMQLTVAERHAECPISFEPLHLGRVGVFLDGRGRRVSPHFFQFKAASDWLATGSAECPMTRKPVCSVKAVPCLTEDPEGWFAACDVDGNGRLSRREVVEGLKAQLPLDNVALEHFVHDDGAWRCWDTDGSGAIEFAEIVSGDRGLLSFVQATYARSGTDGTPVPDIRLDREAWYRHWDMDGSGSLEFEEVVRAFAKTLRIEVNGISDLRDCLRAAWPLFDVDGDGTVSTAELRRPVDGLADTVIATLDSM